MKTFVTFWYYIAEFLEWGVFRTNLVGKRKTHIYVQ